MQQLKWIYEILQQLCTKKYTGSIQINFFQGNITNVNKNESLKAPTE